MVLSVYNTYFVNECRNIDCLQLSVCLPSLYVQLMDIHHTKSGGFKGVIPSLVGGRVESFLAGISSSSPSSSSSSSSAHTSVMLGSLVEEVRAGRKGKFKKGVAVLSSRLLPANGSRMGDGIRRKRFEE